MLSVLWRKLLAEGKAQRDMAGYGDHSPVEKNAAKPDALSNLRF
jgi:hypothetical protein